MKRLRRTVQCDKCPWRAATDPRDIPNGYSETMHERLRGTVAEGLAWTGRVMACHETPLGREAHCVGWLVNQLGQGNNILLRLHIRQYANADRLRTRGAQHEKFEDTLPRSEA